MPRTESKSIQVHPRDEQSMIDLMQKFGWNMISTQEIKTKDSHLEERGDSLVSVTETEHYVKLAFSRDLDTAHLNELRALEEEYFKVSFPRMPSMFPGGPIVWIVLCLFCFIGVIAWPLYYFLSYKPKKVAAEKLTEQLKANRQRILDDLRKYS